MTRVSWTAGLILVAMGLLLRPTPDAHAQGTGESRVVEGQVVIGTVGGGDVSDLAVVFHRESTLTDEHLETLTDSLGRFRFDGILYDPEKIYGVTVIYQGALYGVDVDFSAGSPPPVSLTVYEAGSDVSMISVSSASMLIGQVDKMTQTVWALEIARVRNHTDRTFVPGPEPMQLLRFGLPDGAHDLQVDTNLLAADVLQVDLGFALSASVPPGEHQVMYAYLFPYSGDEVVMGKFFRFGVDNLRVLAPYGEVRISSPELGVPESVSIGDRPYQLLQALDLPRGSRLSIALRGLPLPSLSERLGRTFSGFPVEYAAPLVLAILMAGLIGYSLWRRGAARRTAVAERAGHSPVPPAERDRLIQEIAGLEVEFENGGVSERQYLSERDALTARLTVISTDPPSPSR